MYSKENKIINDSGFSLKTFVKSKDFYNSKFLYILPMLPSLGTYKISLEEYRIDLISLDVYKDLDYAELILLYNGLTIDQLHRGVKLRIPNIEHIQTLARNISTIKSPKEFLKKLKT